MRARSFEGDQGRDDSRGSEISLVVERMAFGGAGIGRLSDGRVCFVPRVIPGERVRAHIRARHASYVEADLKEVLEPSADRVRPKCPVFGRCGGCHYQHLTYARQLAIKFQQVAEALQRLGGISNPPVEPIVPSPLEFHYRNRITVHAKSGRIGFFGPRSRHIVEVTQCPIATESVNALLTRLRSSHPRMVRTLCANVRMTAVSARSMTPSRDVSWRLSRGWRSPVAGCWWTLTAVPDSLQSDWQPFSS
jgi:tRNA/tmRNA/rRNA uracil-C5-methylase (TrmA/RlmC/RlmD family)